MAKILVPGSPDDAQENIESDVEIPRATNVVEAMADGAMSDFVLPLRWVRHFLPLSV